MYVEVVTIHFYKIDLKKPPFDNDTELPTVSRRMN